jgi:hypothetical protein
MLHKKLGLIAFLARNQHYCCCCCCCCCCLIIAERIKAVLTEQLCCIPDGTVRGQAAKEIVEAQAIVYQQNKVMQCAA